MLNSALGEKVVFIVHGSPKKVNNDDFFSLFDKIKVHLTDAEFCFIEHGEPNYKDKFADLDSNKSITKVIVQPLLLFRAGHLIEIENSIPSKKFEVRKALSEIDDFPDFYAECISHWLRKKNLSLDESFVIFVGRGSSNQTANSEFYRISRLIWEKIGKKGYIQIAFAEVTRPSVYEVISNTRSDNFEKIFIIPLLLFRGYVLEKIAKDVLNFSAREKMKIYVIPPVARISDEKLSIWISKSIKG